MPFITMKKSFQLYFIVFFILHKTINILANCKISFPSGLPSEYQPLYLYTENRQGFIYPVPESKAINIKSNDSILLSCPGKFFTDKKIKSSDRIITCLQNGEFKFGSKKLKTLKDMKCSGYAQPTEIIYHNTECGNFGVKKSIGYNIETADGTIFYPLIDFCHETRISHTIYAHSQIQGGIKSQKVLTYSYIKKNILLDIVYSPDKQIDTFTQILGDRKLANKFIRLGKNKDANYLVKSHMVSMADLVFNSHQYATNSYSNIMPVWKNINSGNWQKIRNAIQRYAINKNCTLDIWTGSIGVLQMKDKDNILRDIYLDNDNLKKRSVPVPKLIVKVVKDIEAKAGIVFITINNPYLQKIKDHYVICKNICSTNEIWIRWNFNDYDSFNVLSKGYTYCCGVYDFLKAIPYSKKVMEFELLS